MSRIVTFYSYKGGVGRTFALANIAVLLAKRGKKVLVMDWDLEAPGVHRYFMPYIEDRGQKEGILHALHQATSVSSAWQRVVTDVKIEDWNLSFVPSGDQAQDYISLLRQFSWIDFFEREGGGDILQQWRTEWRNSFDFILIDSRTGLTDAGGVCTVFLPDILALVFTSNDQSFERGIQVTLGAQQARRELSVPRPPLAVLPIPSRFDGRDEIDEAKTWLDRFSRELKVFYDDWLPKQFVPRQILELTKVPYVTKFSFGEPLPVISHGVTDPELPGFYFEIITRLLASDFRDVLPILSPDATSSNIVSDIRSLLAQVPIDEAALATALDNLPYQLGDSAEIAQLLNDSGTALLRQTRLELAESCFRRAVLVSQDELGTTHPVSILSLNNLAELLHTTDRVAEEESLRKQVLSLLEKSTDRSDPAVLAAYNNLATLYRNLGRYSEAEEIYRLAITIVEERGTPPTLGTLSLYVNLGRIYRNTNRLDAAEDTFVRALFIGERLGGESDSAMAGIYFNLAALYHDIGRLSQSEEMYRRTLTVAERLPNATELPYASAYNGLARLYRDTGQLAKAEDIYLRGLSFSTIRSGKPIPSSVLSIYRGLASLYIELGRFHDAEENYKRAIATAQSSARPVGATLLGLYSSLARLYRRTGRPLDAESTYLSAVDLARQSQRFSPSLLVPFSDLGRFYSETERSREAEAIYKEMLVFGSRATDARVAIQLARARNRLAELYMLQSRFQEAEGLLRENLAGLAGTTAPNNLVVSRARSNLAKLLEITGRPNEATEISQGSLFDAMILHGSKDRLVVRQVAFELRARGVRVWLDELELAPGDPFEETFERVLSTIPVIVVCIGRDGLAEREGEILAAMRQAGTAERSLRVIPVLLPGSEGSQKLPYDLMRLTLLDLRDGIDKTAMDRLAWGITGRKPSR